MSAAAYARGSRKLSRDIDRSLNDPNVKFRMDVSAELHKLEDQLAKVTARKVELIGELEAEKASRFKAQMDAERLEKLLAQADKRASYWEDQSARNGRLLPAITAKWQKLSQIVRWAIPPDQYREHSEDFDRLYPTHPAATDEHIEQSDWAGGPPQVTP